MEPDYLWCPLSIVIALFLILGFILTGYNWYRTSAMSDPSRWAGFKKEAVVGKTFTAEEVSLGGFSYAHCTFSDVTLVWRGEKPFDLTNNTFQRSLVVKMPTQFVNAIQFFKELQKGQGSVVITITDLKARP